MLDQILIRLIILVFGIYVLDHFFRGFKSAPARSESIQSKEKQKCKSSFNTATKASFKKVRNPRHNGKKKEAVVTKQPVSHLTVEPPTI